MSNQPLHLPVKPDSSIMNMLIRAQSFLKHAHHHATIGNEFDTMISLHNLDNAIEYILKIIIIHLDIEAKTGKTILENAQMSSLIGDINKYLSSINAGGLPHMTEIKMIRQLRNMVQHSITFPSVDLQRYMDIGQSFFEKVLHRYFGLSYSEISYSTLISNPILKQHLLDAEKHINEKEFLKVVVSSRNAFEYGQLAFEQFRQDRINLAPALAETVFNKSKLHHYIEDLDQRVTIISHGIEYAKYVRYRDIIQDIPNEYNADNVIMMQHERNWSQDDALFCYTFVSNTIYDWQINEPPKNYTPEDFYDINRLIIMNIAGIDVDKDYEYRYMHCGYGYGKYKGELLYVGESVATPLKKLAKQISPTQSVLLSRSVQNKLHRQNPYLCQLITELTIDILPVTNAPAIWRVILWYRPVPFSCNFNNSKISINDVSLDQLLKCKLDKLSATSLLSEIQRMTPVDTIEKAINLSDIIEQYDADGISLHNLKSSYSQPLLDKCKEMADELTKPVYS